MKKGLPLLISGLLLIVFGLLAVYSVSIYESFTLTLSPKFPEPTNYYYFKQQIASLVYIAVALFVVWKFPMRILKSHTFASVVIIIAFILQILVFVPGIGAEYHGARGWISLPVIPNIQPSEVFKLAQVFFLASWLVRRR
jgi:cell division protein FtsW